MDAALFGLGFYQESDREVGFNFYVKDNVWYSPFSVDISNDNSLYAWCLKHKKEVVINDFRQDYPKYVTKVADNKQIAENNIQSLIYMPLLIEESIIGILVVQSRKLNAYDAYQVEIFKALASYVTIAIENAKLFKDVQFLASRDYLTNLYNRNYFLKLAEKELLKFKRYGKIFSIVMFDLDHFKDVNDKFGHDIGDLLLKEVTNFVGQRIKSTDLFCRFGGEEFLLLLPYTSLSEALVFSNRIRKELSGFKIRLDVNFSYHITASFGVSCIGPEDISVDQVIKRADTALYGSKSNGRNMVSYLV